MGNKKRALVSRPILFDMEELNKLDEVVGFGNRNAKMRELVREFNKKQKLNKEKA